MNDELKRNIILEHYQNPHNKGLIEDETYIKTNMNNESCVDELDIMIKYEDDTIKDIKFDGEACAICISSASIMTDTLIGKTKAEAKKILEHFFNMINDKEYDATLLNQATVYSDISKSPSREKCVLLSWWGIEKLLDQLQ